MVVESLALFYLAFLVNKKTVDTAQSRTMLQEQLDSTSSMAAQATKGIEGMTATSRDLAASSQGMASGAKDQAASLEQTSASLEQITATVRHTAEMAAEANLLASSSEDAAEQAGRGMLDLVAAMGETNTASTEIVQIIATINEIAFQTNLGLAKDPAGGDEPFAVKQERSTNQGKPLLRRTASLSTDASSCENESGGNAPKRSKAYLERVS